MDAQHNIFPEEIICKILGFLSPQDVIRLRAVSKRFRAITYDPAIWKDLYTNAPLPRPPGPFPFQSTQYLEHTLVRSAQLARSWTTQPMKDAVIAEIPIKWETAGSRIINERWLIDFHPPNSIVSIDIETRSRHVLWEREGLGLIAAWDVCSITTIAGQLVYIIVEWRNCDPSDASRNFVELLELRVNDNSGQIHGCISLTVPGSGPSYSEICLYPKAPFVYLLRECLVFDIRTRSFYEFPELSTKLPVTLLRPVLDPWVILTTTHVIKLSEITGRSRTGNNQILIQTFLPPTCPQPGITAPGVLRLSHEGILDMAFRDVFPVRNSVIDPITGSTSLRFLCQRITDRNDRQFLCLDLTLSKPHDEIVLPISIDIQNIFSIDAPTSIYPNFSIVGNLYLDASDDGYVRGFQWLQLVDFTPTALGAKLCPVIFVKFTVDATGNKCVSVVGELSPSTGNHLGGALRAWFKCFDCIGGRVWYSDRERFVVRAIDFM